jgi:hypothetical protein
MITEGKKLEFSKHEKTVLSTSLMSTCSDSVNSHLNWSKPPHSKPPSELSSTQSLSGFKTYSFINSWVSMDWFKGIYIYNIQETIDFPMKHGIFP